MLIIVTRYRDDFSGLVQVIKQKELQVVYIHLLLILMKGQLRSEWVLWRFWVLVNLTPTPLQKERELEDRKEDYKMMKMIRG